MGDATSQERQLDSFGGLMGMERRGLRIDLGRNRNLENSTEFFRTCNAKGAHVFRQQHQGVARRREDVR